jgi:uncharacterized protein HemY
MIDEAKPLLRQAEEEAEHDPELAIVLARFFGRQAQESEAMRYYDIAAQRDDLEFAAILEEARLYERSGDQKRAEEKYVALAEEGGDPMGKVILGEYYLRGGKYDEARNLFTSVAGNQPFVYRYIAVCQAETGDVDGAISSLTSYLENNCPVGPTMPGTGAENPPVREAADSVHGESPWEPFRRVAEIAISKGMPDKAARALEIAINCGVETADLWEMLGDAYNAQGDKDNAGKAYNKALNMTEQDSQKNRLRDKLRSVSE